MNKFPHSIRTRRWSIRVQSENNRIPRPPGDFLAIATAALFLDRRRTVPSKHTAPITSSLRVWKRLFLRRQKTKRLWLQDSHPHQEVSEALLWLLLMTQEVMIGLPWLPTVCARFWNLLLVWHIWNLSINAQLLQNSRNLLFRDEYRSCEIKTCSNSSLGTVCGNLNCGNRVLGAYPEWWSFFNEKLVILHDLRHNHDIWNKCTTVFFFPGFFWNFPGFSEGSEENSGIFWENQKHLLDFHSKIV